MAYLWMTGGVSYYWHWERNESDGYQNVPSPASSPPVSIIVQCHDESDNVDETIAYLLEQNFPNFEIVAVNDGSTDNTAQLLDELKRRHAFQACKSQTIFNDDDGVVLTLRVQRRYKPPSRLRSAGGNRERSGLSAGQLNYGPLPSTDSARPP